MKDLKSLPSKDPVQLTDSDRFVANWLVDHITALSNEQHEKLTERLSIQEADRPEPSKSGGIWRRRYPK